MLDMDPVLVRFLFSEVLLRTLESLRSQCSKRGWWLNMSHYRVYYKKKMISWVLATTVQWYTYYSTCIPAYILACLHTYILAYILTQLTWLGNNRLSTYF